MLKKAYFISKKNKKSTHSIDRFGKIYCKVKFLKLGNKKN